MSLFISVMDIPNVESRWSDSKFQHKFNYAFISLLDVLTNSSLFRKRWHPVVTAVTLNWVSYHENQRFGSTVFLGRAPTILNVAAFLDIDLS